MNKEKCVNCWRWALLASLLLAIGGWFYYHSQFGKIELRLGIYSVGSWDVP
ncbi:MAG: sugar ABC transporter substrate-binding protein, partial [Streptococcus minor]|nr:sugar ABC transporter substrate-binding protein [Streptococcus minor]